MDYSGTFAKRSQARHRNELIAEARKGGNPEPEIYLALPQARDRK